MQRGLVIFRLEAGAKIGLGHLMRDTAVARSLAWDGWSVGFAVSAESHDLVAAEAGDIGDVRSPAAGESAAAALRRLWPAGCDWLVVDCYDLDDAFERDCRGWARRIAVFEDRPNRRHDCDLLVDPTLGRIGGAYDALVPVQAARFCGADYAALDDGFRRRRIAGTAARRSDLPAAQRRLFACFGGGDTGEILVKLLDALAAAEFPWPVDVAAVGGAAVRARLDGLMAGLAPGSRLYVDRLDIADLMAGAWVAVGAAGTMAWQRACLGLPSVMVEIAANQADVAAALARSGAATSLGAAADFAGAAAGAAIRRLFEDAAAHRAMSDAALGLTDGLGARRVAAAFAPERDQHGRAIGLRRAAWRDADIMLAWQSAPGARQHARNPQVPTRAEHAAWLRRRLVDPLSILNIVEVDGRPAGLVRLDGLAGGDAGWEVSILIAPEWQGAGVGRGALAAARRLVPEVELVAEVLPGNEPSHRLFRAASYEWRGDRYVHPARRRAGAVPQRAAG